MSTLIASNSGERDKIPLSDVLFPHELQVSLGSLGETGCPLPRIL